tara:strand:+ start:2409 stop:3002 length:594 start_codon:yes stop_codon:yes gene_type:complete
MADAVRSLYGGPLAKLANALVSKKLLEEIAECIIGCIIEEGKKDFAKRGWKLEDPKGGKPFHESFSFQIRGQRTIEIRSTFWGLKELVTGDIPSRRMTWLTQEGKDKIPTDYNMTRTETDLGMKRAGRVFKGERKPLVVPLMSDAGTVIFRTAPLKMKDAWIHPGIAKFTFMERGVRKGRKKCAEAVRNYLKEQLGA